MVERLSGAALVVDALDTTAVFRLRKSYECTGDLTRDFLVGGRGQLAHEVFQYAQDLTGTDDIDIPFADTERERRAGFYVDGGAGEWSFEIVASLSETPVHDEYLQMGDNPDETVLTETSATGADPRTQADVFQRMVREARTDSESPAFLHIGHYHDGTYSDGGEPGLFGDPLAVVIPDGPRPVETSDASSTVDVSLTCTVAGTATITIDAAQYGGW